MLNALKMWMRKATRIERLELANQAKTTLGTVRQIAGSYRSEGRANIGPELARRIELASIKLNRPGLPIVKREELCSACKRCEYLKAKQ